MTLKRYLGKFAIPELKAAPPVPETPRPLLATCPGAQSAQQWSTQL